MRPRESLAVFMVREGFAFGLADLAARLLELGRVARELEAPSLTDYVEARTARLAETTREITSSLSALTALTSVPASVS